jgi:hypothetical protein
MDKKYFVLGMALAAALRAAPDLTFSGVYESETGYRQYITLGDGAINTAHVARAHVVTHTERVRRVEHDRYNGLVVYTDKSIYRVYEHGNNHYILYVNDADGTPRASMLLRKE